MRTLVITGAGRGIGLEWSKRALQGGDRVLCVSRTLTPELTGLVREFEGRAEALQADVSTDEGAKKIAAHPFLKGHAVDILVNNAGVLHAENGLEDVNFARVEESLRINAIGPMRVTRALLAHLQKSQLPIVASVTSLMGSIADNRGGGYYSYRMSKAALNMFNKSFSVDEPGIIAIVLHPGWVQTRMGGSGATVTAADSVSGMMKVVSGLKASDTGRFFNYTGKELPW
ncbi:MAG TPA: SDR family oxidoreductase [Bdellovibrionales bacterium]|nr:SDR family oxidoreductase [Bdellovibrionales bacterium]